MGAGASRVIGAAGTPNREVQVEGDGHVHLYPEFDVAGVIDSALARSRASACPELLLLVDPEGARGHSELEHRELECAVSTSEPMSLRFDSDGGLCIAIAGRQFVSDEGVEVLGIGLAPDSPTADLTDRRHSARALIDAVLEAGAAAVLPWGLGKWIGARGRTVAALCAEPSLRAEPRFVLGDVGQRCRPWPRPAVFDTGPRLLCGSDPLPVPGAERRIGRYGFRMACELGRDEPARSFLEALAAGATLEVRGRPESALSTLAEQWRYRRRRRAL